MNNLLKKRPFSLKRQSCWTNINGKNFFKIQHNHFHYFNNYYLKNNLIKKKTTFKQKHYFKNHENFKQQKRNIHVGIVGTSIAGLTLANFLAQSSQIKISIFEQKKLPLNPIDIKNNRGHQTVLNMETINIINKIKDYEKKKKSGKSIAMEIFESGCFVENLQRFDFRTGIKMAERKGFPLQIPQILWAHSGIIRGYLLKNLTNLPNVRLLDAVKITEISEDPTNFFFEHTDENTSETGFRFRTDLLIAADGPYSLLRGKIFPNENDIISQNILYMDGLMRFGKQKEKLFSQNFLTTKKQKNENELFPLKTIINFIQEEKPFSSVSFLRLDEEYVAWAAEVEDYEQAYNHKKIRNIEEILSKLSNFSKKQKTILQENNKAGVCSHLIKKNIFPFFKKRIILLGNSAHPFFPSTEQSCNIGISEAEKLSEIILNLESQRSSVNLTLEEIENSMKKYNDIVLDNLKKFSENPENNQNENDKNLIGNNTEIKPNLKFY